MATMSIIEPLIMRDLFLQYYTSTILPLETDYAEWAIGTTYGAGDIIQVSDSYGRFLELLTIPSASWACVVAGPSGNIYLGDDTPGVIYVRMPGSATFSAIPGCPSRVWSGMTQFGGNIYACCSTGASVGDIFMRTTESGNFVSLSQADRLWSGMCSSPTDVYACVYGGDIYKQTAGAGSFAATTAGNKNWSGICAKYTGGFVDLYACVYGGSIWVKYGAGGGWTDLGETNRNWNGLTMDRDGNIIATVYGGEIYKLNLVLGGHFNSTTSTARNWGGVCMVPEYDLYAPVTGATSLYASRDHISHKVYQSLVGSNLANFPPTDISATTPKWTEMCATNRWKALDGKIFNQATLGTSLIYKFGSMGVIKAAACLNLFANSVKFEATTGSYSNTVTTGATDIVDLALPGGGSDIITITIAQSVYPYYPKVGEIILGNKYNLGTLRPSPTVSITDYSTKTQDEYGDLTIVPRSYSKKMSVGIQIPTASVDAVFNKLAGYRSTPLVWVGSTAYSSLIIYGFFKDFSIVFSSNRICDCSLEIEGLT